MTGLEEARRRIAETARNNRRDGNQWRIQELLWMLIVSVVVVLGLFLVYQAKSAGFAEVRKKLQSGQIADINAATRSSQLLPNLDIQNGEERVFTADRIIAAIHRRKLPNVGALATIRVHEEELRHKPTFELTKRLTQAQARRASAESVPLLGSVGLQNIKPFFVVRSPSEFRNAFLLYAALFFFFFLGVHVFWSLTRFTGDCLILPAIELLCGTGFMLMVSLRDPLRDLLIFGEFTQGIVAGCVALAVFSIPNYDAQARRYSFIFLLFAALLGVLLFFFGTGPGASDAKVNLFIFQPVEIIRVLIVLFLAGYFAENWDLLRDLRQKTGGVAKYFNVPRIDYVLPVVVGVGIAIGIFAVLKDNGPALVLGCLFLMLYAIARKRGLAACVGFAAIILVFYVGHRLRWPSNVANRVDMWSSPWRNTVSGGDQIAHSLWALSSGGARGTGLGIGSPGVIPAGYTDLILPVAGEELGFIGFLGIFLLYGVLAWRGIRIALRAPSSYSFFLVLGLTLIVCLQLILIAGGALGLIPLSGVVSPFLSFGKTSMVANFITFAIILAISARSRTGEPAQIRNFGRPTYWSAGLLFLCGCAIVGRAAYIQAAKADEFVIKDAEVRLADESLTLEYNPRIREILLRGPKGDVLDRNGLPVATSNWDTVEQHRRDYLKLGVSVDQTALKSDPRHYPLGPEFYYLVGDVRSLLQRGARNTAFVEREARTRLQGFDDRRQLVSLHDDRTDEDIAVYHYDYSDLVPVLRHQWEPDYPAVKSFMERDRDVKMSIDSRLQLRASAILKNHLERSGKRGALVVLDPETGDTLAAVSYPWPDLWQFRSFRANPARTMEPALLDRARFGLYPPGSSFKIVTAIAALRLNPALDRETFECKALGDGRVGNYVGKSTRPIRDDERDHVAHGTVNLEKGIVVSCNAFFAQLGTYKVGPQALFQTAQQLNILVAHPNTPEKLRESMPQASYGQGQVVASPFQMARVAATIANSGKMPQGRWIIDESNTRIEEPVALMDPEIAKKLAGYMREVVTSGTGTALRGSPIPIAGKTGTAELLQKKGVRTPSHAWFIGFAPYGSGNKKIAFAILVENGGYGGTSAAPIAGEIVQAAKEAGLL